MMVPPLHKSAPLFLAWVGGLCGAVILMLADVPIRLPFATPGHFLACVVELEIFFVLLVWPFFVPRILKESPAPPALLAYVGTLLLFALPLVLIAANVAGEGAGAVVRTQALVAGLASTAAGVAALASARRAPILPWYFLAVFWISAAHPFWSFLEHQLGARSPEMFVYVSPFWGAVHADPAPAWVQAALFGIAGVGLLAAARKKAAA